jgi:uncharacterized protein YutE (UPF0331/DUF86 family)
MEKPISQISLEVNYERFKKKYQYNELKKFTKLAYDAIIDYGVPIASFLYNNRKSIQAGILIYNFIL